MKRFVAISETQYERLLKAQNDNHQNLQTNYEDEINKSKDLVYENNEILNKQMIKQISDLDKSNNVNNLNNSKNTQNFANDSTNLQNLTNDFVNNSTKALNDEKGIDGLQVILDYTKKLLTKKSE